MELERVRQAERNYEDILQGKQQFNGFIRFHPSWMKVAVASRIQLFCSR